MADRQEITRKYRESHREEIREKSRLYQAKRRADPAHLEKLRIYAKTKYHDDPETARAENRRRYAQNAELYRERARRWKRNNPDRVAEINHAIRASRASAPTGEPFSKQEIFDRDGGRCHLCGGKCSPQRFELDHLIPLSRGGSECATNVAVAHPTCNRRRGAGFVPAQLRLMN